MNEALQHVKDALVKAQATQDPVTALMPNTSFETVIRVMAQQTSATNAAVLAWLAYQVQQEEQKESTS